MEKESIAEESKRSNGLSVNDDKLKGLSILGETVLAVKRDIVYFEKELKIVQETLRHLEEVAVPEAMTAVGINSFTMEDGSYISIKDITVAHIKEDNRAEAHEWLTNHGFGAIVKNKFIVDFGKGDNKKAEAFIEMLEADSRFATWSNKESVHHSTLKATVTEQLDGGNVDFLSEDATELLGIRKFKHAKVQTGGE